MTKENNYIKVQLAKYERIQICILVIYKLKKIKHIKYPNPAMYLITFFFSN